MSNLLGPRDANGIPVAMTVDESIASMKASLLKNIKRSAYVCRVDCGGCNGCAMEIPTPLCAAVDAERFGIKVVPSPRHADILLFTGAVTRAMRSPALRAQQSAPDPKICISYGACVASAVFSRSLPRLGRYRQNRPGGCVYSRLPANALPPRCVALRWRLACWSKKIHARAPGETDDQPAEILHPDMVQPLRAEGGSRGAPAGRFIAMVVRSPMIT